MTQTIFFFQGCTVDVYKDEEDNFVGLFFQDKYMKDDFQAYPEIIFFDGTYKLMDLRFPVYIIMIEDSMGQSEVAGIGILANETSETLSWLMKVFKQRNETKKMRVVMADKDLAEREAITTVLGVPLTICLFHAMRAFRREIASQMNLSTAQQETVKDIFRRMCYAKTEEEYVEMLNLFKEVSSPEVCTYFLKNWHSIKEQWVLGEKCKLGHFFNNTNNRVESFNSKLKSVINHHSSFEEFIEGCFTVINTLRNERNHKAAEQLIKVPVNKFSSSSPEASYQNFLTGYAFEFVLKQLENGSKVEVLNETDEGIEAKISGKSTIVSTKKCTCCFFRSMKLPCSHLFAARLTKELPLYCPEICDVRWTLQYYRTNQRMFKDKIMVEPSPLSITTSTPRRLDELNWNERFREANKQCVKLAQLSSEVGGVQFVRRIDVLNMLIEFWERGDAVCIKSVGGLSKIINLLNKFSF